MSDGHLTPSQDITQIREVVRPIFPGTPLDVERVQEGGSTYVYRLSTASERFYLRVLPEEGASFGPEVEVHRRLRESGARVPEVVYYEPLNEQVQRSIMVTSEIPGTPMSQPPFLSADELERVLVEAGNDLARVNQIAVAGFGWIDRETGAPGRLQAPHKTYDAFALEFWDADLAFLGSAVLSHAEVRALDQIVSRNASWLESDAGRLAHGDFDPTHIFHQAGHYTGLIDFGSRVSS